MAPTLIFVRHGEATHNVAFREQGESAFRDSAHTDAPLTSTGIEQARATAQELRSRKVLDIWCSPLTRCMQTAEEIFKKTFALRINLHDNLLERLGGGHVCNQRKSKSELKETCEPIFRLSYLPEDPVHWEERENNYSLRQRMWMLCSLVKNIYEEESPSMYVVIVSHNDAIQALTGKSLNHAEFVTLSFEDIT